MCGRYYLKSPGKSVRQAFDLSETPDLAPRYNIAPTTPVAAVRLLKSQPGRELALLRWGLVPFWAKDIKIGARGINARAETAPSKPAFREAMANRRCLIPADGFFEWKRLGKTDKQPYAIQLASREPFAMAGLWERWRAPDGETVESCAILTTDPNALVAGLHDRMPLILPPSAYAEWLDPHQRDPEALRPLMVPYPADEMTAFPVGSRVNRADQDDPECIAPVPGRPQLELEV